MYHLFYFTMFIPHPPHCLCYFPSWEMEELWQGFQAQIFPYSLLKSSISMCGEHKIKTIKVFERCLSFSQPSFFPPVWPNKLCDCVQGRSCLKFFIYKIRVEKTMNPKVPSNPKIHPFILALWTKTNLGPADSKIIWTQGVYNQIGK